MKLFDRILVAVGEGSGSDDLIRYARAVRTMLPEARFCFVHVLGWSTHSQFHAEPVTHTQARQRLEEAVRQHFGDADAQCLVIHGSVPDRILEIAAELPAGVILVGHDREHRGRRSLARRLAMQAPCSVWMKPAGAGASLSRVLAAIDYSEPSAYALSMAGHIARRAGSIECRALHVYLNEAAAGVDEYQAPDRARQREAFDRFTAPLDTAAVELTPVLVEGVDVAAALNYVAKTDPFDLVVMGCRGQSASASTLLGSESEHVMMESAAPVLIAKRQGDRIGLLQVLLDRNFHLPTPPRFG